MKRISVNFLLICILFFLYPPFIEAQDVVEQQQGQVETDTLQMYVRNAQYRQAIEFINGKEPTKDLLYQKGLCYKSLNDYSSAIEIFDSLSEKYPDDVPVILQLALCYEVVSQYSKSIECYNNLLTIDSANTYFKVRKADLLFRSEKYALALDAYSRIDSTYNPNYIAKSIAACYDKLNQTDSAKNQYAKAWMLNEQDAYSANSLVKINLKNEDYLSAYQNSEKFIAKDSTNTTMNALNAYTYYNLKYYDVALERFQKCLQQGDSSLLVNRTLGYIYFQTGRDSLARPFLQQAFLQDTTNNNVLFNLGKANYNLSYYSEAAECFQKMVNNMVSSEALLFTLYKSLAMAQEKNGAFDSALENYRLALGHTEDNNDKMELFFSIANLSDKELKNNMMAIAYYKEYRRCLFNYQNSLKDEQVDEIKDIESKLAALDAYIKQLSDSVDKQ